MLENSLFCQNVSKLSLFPVVEWSIHWNYDGHYYDFIAFPILTGCPIIYWNYDGYFYNFIAFPILTGCPIIYWNYNSHYFFYTYRVSHNLLNLFWLLLWFIAFRILTGCGVPYFIAIILVFTMILLILLSPQGV